MAIDGLTQCPLYVLNFSSQDSQPIQPLRMGFEVHSRAPGWERLASVYRGFCCLWFWEYFSIFSKEILLMRPELALREPFSTKWLIWKSQRASGLLRLKYKLWIWIFICQRNKVKLDSGRKKYTVLERFKSILFQVLESRKSRSEHSRTNKWLLVTKWESVHNEFYWKIKSNLSHIWQTFFSCISFLPLFHVWCMYSQILFIFIR